MRRAFLTCLAGALIATSLLAQDSQSLGDAARQARRQKQQRDTQIKDVASKEAQGKDSQGPKAPKVYTNDEIPERAPSAVPHNPDELKPVNYTPQPGTWKAPAETWKNQILMMKNSIASMQARIDQLNESVHFAGNCVVSCGQYNERQREKQQQIETMKSQVDELKKQLETMQESARQQGYGSSVYDP